MDKEGAVDNDELQVLVETDRRPTEACCKVKCKSSNSFAPPTKTG